MEDTRNIKDIAFASLNKDAIFKRTHGDKYIWGIVLLLSVISILVVYSATGSLAYKLNKGNNEIYLFKQLSFTVLGLLTMYFLHRINYTLFSRIDVAKLGLFMYISKIMSKKQDVIKDFKNGFLPVVIPVFIICGLIMPANLSNALLTGATSLLLMFIGRVSLKHILLTICVALIPILIIVGIAWSTYDGQQTTDKSKATTSQKLKSIGRIGTWVKRVQDHLFAPSTETPYQVQQAKIAIAKGGILMGKGPGNSEQRNFLPQAYNDFIYSIIIEEYGLLGAAIIIIIYLVFLFRCIRIFRKCPYAFGAFLALALSFTLVIQAVANMAVNVNIVPVTGVTLPLVSMGGSSFLFTCAAIGIILSVARNVEQLEGNTTTVVNNIEPNNTTQKVVNPAIA